MRLARFRIRPRRPAANSAPIGMAVPLAQLDELADSAVALAQQIKQTVAELRLQDERGNTDDPTR